MLTEQLPTRQDLVESLDSEAIFDYLIQHGVLDEGTRDGIRGETTKVQRNTALLQHLQGNGDSAIALFINALRQSGQLVLASSLDVTSKIKPTYGSGYLGKERYKGQVTIKILVDSIKGFFPKWEEGDQLEEKHGDTPEKEVKPHGGTNINDLNVLLTPRRMHKSYENMTMIDGIGDGSKSKMWRIHEYSYEKEGYDTAGEEEEDGAKSKGFCWCLCIPRRKKAKKYKQNYPGPAKERQRNESPRNVQPRSRTTNKRGSSPFMSDISSSAKGQQKIKGESSNTYSPKKTEVSMQRNSNGQDRSGKVQYNVKDTTPSVTHSKVKHTGSDRTKHKEKTKNGVNQRGRKGESRAQSHSSRSENKENTPPVVSGTSTPKKHATSIKNTHSRSSDSVLSGDEEPVEFCVMWKSRGPTFDQHVDKFNDIVDKDVAVKSQIVKYFEQERGTLVLSVYCSEDTLVICNICMTCEQVKNIQADERSGLLTELIEGMMLKKSVIESLNVEEIKLQVAVDDNEIDLAMDDLR
ncbi:uncharacterized protein LOC117314821 [Pecten maximus]|uniref:uncharacterized protein LOC117314821 n=1 Tax=Pecten maximus TaxID=6579 RepID=UPI0014587863|nr:uncharacterized protein LOC117314821 [Pecten maximus]XP_033724817.1 uncharacterized protein LOC117314821 [Pecten maximus]XP_033724818.1 uncharacterized protein LOC117314821 [Pecten maximus]XP_033724819.1 uncharacterized protein LOC117314821 [Pecten maximus]XP_033724820.1 uncharacterized protein LOC117314821 [Pecten maximus]